MSLQERDDHADISRRNILAASGLVAVSGLSGCLNRLASSVTNTTAAPAATFAGVDWNDDETAVSVGDMILYGMTVDEPRVSRLAPVLSDASGFSSGDIELEAWVTSVSISMEDYNSPRSNRSVANLGDIVGDDVDESEETFRVALELEAELQGAADMAVASISKRSAQTGRNPETDREITASIDEMDRALSELRSVLERCSNESCVGDLANVSRIEEVVRNVRGYVENEQWDAAIEALGGDNTSPIYEGDAVGGESAIHRSSIAPPDGPLSGEEREALIGYLGGEPVIGERFTVCVPDAEVPGGGGSIREELSPQRFIDYITGRSDADGQVYSWGHSEVAADGTGDCDDESVCESPHLSAAILGPMATGGGLVAARNASGTVNILNTPPTAEGGASALVCPADGVAYEPKDLSDWGRGAEGGGKASPYLYDTLVCQVMVQPPECPHAFPALLYVGRGVSDGQLVYAGGWVIDEAALFEDSATALTMAGAAQVIGVECCFDYSADYISRLVSGERARRGARIDSGSVGSLVESGVLSDSEFDPDDPVVNDFLRYRSEGDRESTEGIVVTHVALDAPLLHLVEAGDASDEMKFKAGAELSKSVN